MSSQLYHTGNGKAQTRVVGEAMEPKYHSGTLLKLKKIDSDNIIYGQDHVLQLEHRLLFRRLEASKENDNVRAIAYSKDPSFAPLEIPLRKITAVYVVTGLKQKEINY